VAGEDFFNEEQKYYEAYEKNKVNVFCCTGSSKNFSNNNIYNGQIGENSISPNNINLDFLDKLSIFLKVSSGTYTLSKSIE